MTMRPRDRIALAAFVVVALVAAYYLLALKPVQRKAAAVGASIATQRQALTLAQADVAAGLEARRVLTTNAEEVASLGRAVPAKIAIQPLLRSLDRMAHARHVRLKGIQITGSAAPSAPATSSPPATSTTPATSGAPAPQSAAAATAVTPVATQIQLTVAGSYLALDDFFHHLDGFVVVTGDKVRAKGRLVNVSSLQIDGAPHPVAHVTATIYQLPAPTSAVPATGGAAG